MRRCECSVRSPSKRMNRCLPRASTARTPRPSRRSGQRSIVWRGWGVSIATIGLPTNAAPTRRAAEWMVSPSGTRPNLGRAQVRSPLPAGEVVARHDFADRRYHVGLAHHAEAEARLEQAHHLRHARPADVVLERLERARAGGVDHLDVGGRMAVEHAHRRVERELAPPGGHELVRAPHLTLVLERILPLLEVAGEALVEPGVVVLVVAHDAEPPLVRDLVGDHLFEWHRE